MSMSLTVASVIKDNDKELLNIDENNVFIISEYADELIYEYVDERIFYEKYKDEYEEVSYKVINDSNIETVINILFEEENKLFEKYKKTKSSEEKNDIFEKLFNTSSIKDVILKHFILKNENILVIY
ncbi:hypothetical protein [Brachyspira intermedia]|uniref:hypothetical protein n=1 Tax=Brachyspira intermedia TaxID=84377 RepID=UPI00300493ED